MTSGLSCKGTTIPPSPPPAENRSAVLPGGPFSRPGRALRALVVEDNRLNAAFLKTALEKFRAACDAAANGMDAVQMAEANRYDLILMDCQLPVMDGFAASEAIRRLKAPHGGVPIIALTANASSEDRARCLRAGMNGHLAKPISLETLYQKICHTVGPVFENDAPPEKFEESLDLLVREMHFTAEEARHLPDEFILSIPDFLQRLALALEGPDRAGISAFAHQLKGVACNLRLRELQTASGSLEAAAKDPSGVLKDKIEAVEALFAEYSAGHS